jgi:hypothetical protein
VLTNKKVNLENIQGAYKTAKIELDKGEYTLTKFLVLKASDTAIYATPMANTQKAAEVLQPLPFNFVIAQKGSNAETIKVLNITGNDLPEKFGYAADDFGYQVYINLQVKVKLNVGQVEYDNLPGHLKIDAINSQGNHWLREFDLQKGLNTIRVPEAYTNYQFKVAKWNVIAQKSMSRQELLTTPLITLEAARQPKRLIKEESFIENGYGLVPDSRSEYYYNGTGQLAEIENYQKSIHQTGLHLANIYKFRYSGAQLDTIYRNDPDNSATGYTAFFYAGGKITNMYNKNYDQETGVAIEYSNSNAGSIIEGNYLFKNGNTMVYKMRFVNGNREHDEAISSTGAGETGVYEYDDHINPKHQLGHPDLYFTNNSKNNLFKEQKSFGGSIPQAVPYKFEYTYDADGYPAEVYMSYKGFSSQQHLYRLKKVFKYQ